MYKRLCFLISVLTSIKIKNFVDGDFSKDNERVVENSFIENCLLERNNVADMGFAYAEDRWYFLLNKLKINNLVGIDLATQQRIDYGVYKMKLLEDMREMNIESKTFDAILCVSTLEHVGMNNKIYGFKKENRPQDQSKALDELYRILRNGGRLYLTLPFGHYQVEDWYVQYDLEHLMRLITSSKFITKRMFCYKENNGWRFEKSWNFSDVYYQAEKHRAGGVVCLILQKQ